MTFDPTSKIIFCHTPKCGGATLRKAFKRRYRDRVWMTNDAPGDQTSPMHTNPDAVLAEAYSANLDGYDVIMGHLWAKRFEHLQGVRRVTLLRNPIDRLISHYFFWKNKPFHPRFLEHETRRWFLTENPSLEETALHPTFRYFFTRYFFKDVDMGTFDFIVDTDTLTTRWSELDTVLNLGGVPMDKRNDTTRFLPTYHTDRATLLADSALMARLADILGSDIDFYHKYTNKGKLAFTET